jgi:hypothetical protein
MKNSFKAYNELINPLWIRGLIKTESRFIDWCKEKTISDLEIVLMVFETEQMYSDCEIVRNVLQQKQNEETIKILLS